MKAPQNYSNHAKYYAPHHFVFYPIILVLLCIGVRGFITDTEHQLEWAFVTGLVLMIGWLSFMTRQHYSLSMQNRIIRLEMRLRYYQLTQKRLETIEGKLRFRQIAALRFASDEELPALVQRTLEEQLSARAIKQSIKNWQPDYMRV
jgi:hypothetical protein